MLESSYIVTTVSQAQDTSQLPLLQVQRDWVENPSSDLHRAFTFPLIHCPKTNQDTVEMRPLRQHIQLKPSFIYGSSTLITFYYIITVLILCLCVGDTLAVTHSKLYKANVMVERVPDNYFVHFRPESGPLTIQGVLHELEEQNQDQTFPNFTATVQRVLTLTVNGIAATLSSQAVQYMLAQDVVQFIEEDTYVHSGQLYSSTSDRRTVTSWGLDRMDQITNAYDSVFHAPCGLTGKGVDVYVIDSGIRYDHTQFQGRAMYAGCDIVDETSNSALLYRGNDCFGHGTKVAGIIGGSLHGVAPGANIFSVRVLNCENVGSWNGILSGLECILEKVTQRPDRSAVVNMSIYGSSKNRAIKNAIETLMNRGVTVVSLSGNSETERSGNACKLNPAAIPGVITVAGSTREDEAYNRTRMGSCVDLLAPGKDIVSVDHRCVTCRATRLAGASFAAPHVTGAVALLLEKCPHLPPWKVKHYLLTKMVLTGRLKTKKTIPRRFQNTTPNLLLHTGPEMCTIEC